MIDIRGIKDAAEKELASKLFNIFQESVNAHSGNYYCQHIDHLESRFKTGWLAVAKELLNEGYE